MTHEDILKKYEQKFGSEVPHEVDRSGILVLTVDSSVIYDVVRFFRDEMGFGFLTDLCGIHYPDAPKPLGILYLLNNMKERMELRLKTFVSAENPQVKSMTSLFAGANWMERETFDFFGIIFEGHPNLKRILNVEYMDYFPLRKEYPLEDPTREDKDDKFFGR